MLIATAPSKGGGWTLIVGLEAENMRRLADDRPIQRDLGELIPALVGWTLVVLGPEDTERLKALHPREGDDPPLSPHGSPPGV